MAAFRFALQASRRSIPGCVARPGAQGRGPRVLDPLCARPPRRPVGPHGRARPWRPRPRRRCGSARSSSTTTSATRSSLAKEAATLDVVTGGRFEFGLGAGWMTTDYDQSGIPMDQPSVRVARLAESLDIMRAMWRDGQRHLRRRALPRHRGGRRTRSPTTPGRSAAGHRRRQPAHPHAGRAVRRHRQRRAEPGRRLHRPRGRGRVRRREVRRPGALGPGGGGGARRRARAAVLDGRRAGRPERRRGASRRSRRSSA